MKHKLKDIFDLQMGKTPSRNKTEYWIARDYKWISIADLTKTTKYISETKEYLSESAVEESGIKIIPANTVVMSFKLSIGKVAITSEDMYSNEAIMAFHDKHIVEILPEYIFYMFKYKNWDEGSNKAVMGKTLNKASLSEIEVNICPIEKQKKIIQVLDKLADIISGREQELKLLDELIKARFVEMFGDYYKSLVNEKKLYEICDFIDYRGKTPEKSKCGIPLITAKNVKEHCFCTDPQEFIPEDSYHDIMTRGIPKVNDVLFTTEAPLGNVCRIPDIYNKFCVGQRIITMQPYTEVINSEYLEYALASANFQDKVWQKSSGSTVKGIRSKFLISLTIAVPPINSQNQFADFVTQVNKSKVAVQKALDEAQTLFDSLMQEYFG